MALDGFLELKGQGGSIAIKGECRDRTFAVRGAMQINSFEFGSEGGGASGGTGSQDKHGKEKHGKGPGLANTSKVQGAATAPQLQVTPGSSGSNEAAPEADWTTTLFFKITKDVDIASPELFLAYCENTKAKPVPFAMARVTLRRAGGSEPQVYLVVEFTDVLVTTYSVQSSKDDLPEETVEFTFKKMVKVNYRPQSLHGHGSANIKEFKIKDRPKPAGM